MQTCSHCNSQTPNNHTQCIICNADLSQYATTVVALNNFQENPRVRNIRLVIPDKACPVCSSCEGTYAKNKAPSLPLEGCSQECQCFYEPMLLELYP